MLSACLNNRFGDIQGSSGLCIFTRYSCSGAKRAVLRNRQLVSRKGSTGTHSNITGEDLLGIFSSRSRVSHFNDRTREVLGERRCAVKYRRAGIRRVIEVGVESDLRTLKRQLAGVGKRSVRELDDISTLNRSRDVLGNIDGHSRCGIFLISRFAERNGSARNQ